MPKHGPSRKPRERRRVSWHGGTAWESVRKPGNGFHQGSFRRATGQHGCQLVIVVGIGEGVNTPIAAQPSFGYSRVRFRRRSLNPSVIEITRCTVNLPNSNGIVGSASNYKEYSINAISLMNSRWFEKPGRLFLRFTSLHSVFSRVNFPPANPLDRGGIAFSIESARACKDTTDRRCRGKYASGFPHERG